MQTALVLYRIVIPLFALVVPNALVLFRNQLGLASKKLFIALCLFLISMPLAWNFAFASIGPKHMTLLGLLRELDRIEQQYQGEVAQQHAAVDAVMAANSAYPRDSLDFANAPLLPRRPGYVRTVDFSVGFPPLLQDGPYVFQLGYLNPGGKKITGDLGKISFTQTAGTYTFSPYRDGYADLVYVSTSADGRHHFRASLPDGVTGFVAKILPGVPEGTNESAWWSYSVPFDDRYTIARRVVELE